MEAIHFATGTKFSIPVWCLWFTVWTSI